MFQRTSAINKILKLNKFIRGVQGGTSASKTYGIIAILIDYCAKNESKDCSVVSESIPHLKRGAMKDFKKIMKDTGRWNNDRWHSTDSRYTFKNGSIIEFFSADNDSKLRGARRDVLYMNECNNMTFYSFTELSSRTKDFCFLDWNPTNSFWFHEELQNDSDVDFIIINYLDNEACPESALKMIEKAKEKGKTSKFWANWYRVYGLGEVGSLDGVIFNNWQQIDTIPEGCEFISYGMDFGFTNDPTTLIYLGKYNNNLIISELMYQKNLTNSEISYKVKNLVNSHGYITADSSEPKSIEEIKRHGVKIRGALKGKDSINYGIDLLQSFNLLVTSSSINLIKELRNYTWDEDKNGNKLNKPIDSYNHCFVGETLITTNLGQKRIDRIKVGDTVLTSNGLRSVKKVFNNGFKKTYKYLMQFDTFSIYLCCTEEHKIKTTQGWKPIKNLTVNDTLYIETKSIIVGGAKNYILKYGKTQMEKYQKDSTYTIKTIIHLITQLITYLSFLQKNIWHYMQKKGLMIIQNLQNYFNKKELQKHPNGTEVKKVLNGTKSMQKNLILGNLTYQAENVIGAKKNTSQKQSNQNFVITTAKLNHFEKEEGMQLQVYDIMVDECHEYFANGILVHNCIDALRYAAESISKPKINWQSLD